MTLNLFPGALYVPFIVLLISGWITQSEANLFRSCLSIKGDGELERFIYDHANGRGDMHPKYHNCLDLFVDDVCSEISLRCSVSILDGVRQSSCFGRLLKKKVVGPEHGVVGKMINQAHGVAHTCLRLFSGSKSYLMQPGGLDLSVEDRYLLELARYYPNKIKRNTHLDRDR